MKRVTMAVCMFAAIYVTSTVAMGAQSFKEYGVKFDPKPKQGILKVDTGNQNCTKGQDGPGKRKGCVKFAEDEMGVITFYLGNKVRYCSDSGTQWVISRVELSHQGYYLADGTISEKGVFEGDLPEWLTDAFPQVQQDTGVLYSVVDPQDGVTRVTSINLNNNDADEPPKDIWYRVSVTKCGSDEDETLVSDPRFENDGTSN